MYCRECGKEISGDSRFCTYCGASVASGPASQDCSPNDYASRSTHQLQYTSQPTGKPVWVYIISLSVIGFIVIVFALIAVPTLVSTRNAAMQSFAEGVLATVRSSQAAYYAKNQEYGDLDVLVDEGYLDSRFSSNNITDFDGRDGLNITFTTTGKTYKCSIEVPNVGTLTLDESGEISGP